MAEFSPAYDKFIKPLEGGYANVIGDKGGETYGGIARKFWASYTAVWNFIDAYKSKFGKIKHNQKFKELDAPVRQFYLDMWNRNGFGKINNQDLANIIFDWFVNSGSLAFNTKAPETFGVDEILAKQFGQTVPVDGKLDQTTINAINKVNPVSLHQAIKTEREKFYKRLVERDATQAKFLKGWLARIEKFAISDTGKGVFITAFLAGLFFLGYKLLNNNQA
jgi:lysozyme family protein